MVVYLTRKCDAGSIVTSIVTYATWIWKHLRLLTVTRQLKHNVFQEWWVITSELEMWLNHKTYIDCNVCNLVWKWFILLQFLVRWNIYFQLIWCLKIRVVSVAYSQKVHWSRWMHLNPIPRGEGHICPPTIFWQFAPEVLIWGGFNYTPNLSFAIT